MTTAYGADLARAHHEGFGDLARQAAATLLSVLTEAGVERGLVVDLGSGSGILARIVADAGYRALGYDISEDMVRLAARTAPAPGATFVRSALLDADIPPCVAVTAVGEVLNYAFDPRTGFDQLAPSSAGCRRRSPPAAWPSSTSPVRAGPGPPAAGRPPSRPRDGGSGPWPRRTPPARPSSARSPWSPTTARSTAAARSATCCACTGPTPWRRPWRGAGFVDVRRLDRYRDFDMPPGLTGFLATAGPPS